MTAAKGSERTPLGPKSRGHKIMTKVKKRLQIVVLAYRYILKNVAILVKDSFLFNNNWQEAGLSRATLEISSRFSYKFSLLKLTPSCLNDWYNQILII